MRRMGLIKRGLAAALCCMLCVPAAGMLWEPMEVEATVPDDSKIPQDKKNTRQAKIRELVSYFEKYKNLIEKEKKNSIEESVNAIKQQLQDVATSGTDYLVSDADTDELIATMKLRIDNAAGVVRQEAEGDSNEGDSIPTPDPEPEPTTSNSNIMVGGNWITPVANGGQYVNVVLPIVNMGRRRVKNAVVTPQISQDPAKWPFEIETSNYTQTIDRLPGTDEGGDDMERRRELTWVLKTRKDAPGGYMPIAFDVTYENDDLSLTTVTLTTYVNVKGTTGVSSDGTASTPRVIVTGFLGANVVSHPAPSTF